MQQTISVEYFTWICIYNIQIIYCAPTINMKTSR